MCLKSEHEHLSINSPANLLKTRSSDDEHLSIEFAKQTSNDQMHYSYCTHLRMVKANIIIVKSMAIIFMLMYAVLAMI